MMALYSSSSLSSNAQSRNDVPHVRRVLLDRQIAREWYAQISAKEVSLAAPASGSLRHAQCSSKKADVGFKLADPAECCRIVVGGTNVVDIKKVIGIRVQIASDLRKCIGVVRELRGTERANRCDIRA